MAYSHDSYHDDPEYLEEPNRRKNISSFFALIALVIGGGFFLQTTLAANISLSSGAPVEFGQGTLQTTACSGESQLTLTPTSTFINVAGAGSYKFSSVTVSGIPDSCWEKEFTINAYDETSNIPVALFNTTSTSVVVYNNAGTFSLGTGSTGMTVASGAGTFTVTFTVPVAQSSSIFKLTLQSGAHVAYNVGDRGPGGGIVYYVSADYFTSTGSTCGTQCKYLEVAPAGWNNGAVVANDLLLTWSSNTSDATTNPQDTVTAGTESGFAYEKFNWKIGQGFYNTSVMIVGGGTSTAQAAVLAYAGSSAAGQWFIPSMNELNELCKYARGQTTGVLTVACTSGGTLKTGTANDLGGFVEYWYWSSSKKTWANTWAQNFEDGMQNDGGKNGDLHIRPIRAF
jgi:hypothetical protein